MTRLEAIRKRLVDARPGPSAADYSASAIEVFDRHAPGDIELLLELAEAALDVAEGDYCHDEHWVSTLGYMGLQEVLVKLQAQEDAA